MPRLIRSSSSNDATPTTVDSSSRSSRSSFGGFLFRQQRPSRGHNDDAYLEDSGGGKGEVFKLSVVEVKPKEPRRNHQPNQLPKREQEPIELGLLRLSLHEDGREPDNNHRRRSLSPLPRSKKQQMLTQERRGTSFSPIRRRLPHRIPSSSKKQQQQQPSTKPPRRPRSLERRDRSVRRSNVDPANSTRAPSPRRRHSMDPPASAERRSRRPSWDEMPPTKSHSNAANMTEPEKLRDSPPRQPLRGFLGSLRRSASVDKLPGVPPQRSNSNKETKPKKDDGAKHSTLKDKVKRSLSFWSNKENAQQPPPLPPTQPMTRHERVRRARSHGTVQSDDTTVPTGILHDAPPVDGQGPRRGTTTYRNPSLPPRSRTYSGPNRRQGEDLSPSKRDPAGHRLQHERVGRSASPPRRRRQSHHQPRDDHENEYDDSYDNDDYEEVREVNTSTDDDDERVHNMSTTEDEDGIASRSSASSSSSSSSEEEGPQPRPQRFPELEGEDGCLSDPPRRRRRSARNVGSSRVQSMPNRPNAHLAKSRAHSSSKNRRSPNTNQAMSKNTGRRRRNVHEVEDGHESDHSSNGQAAKSAVTRRNTIFQDISDMCVELSLSSCPFSSSQNRSRDQDTDQDHPDDEKEEEAATAVNTSLCSTTPFDERLDDDDDDDEDAFSDKGDEDMLPHTPGLLAPSCTPSACGDYEMQELEAAQRERRDLMEEHLARSSLLMGHHRGGGRRRSKPRLGHRRSGSGW